MKRNDIKSKMQELGLEVNNDLIDYIMGQNGVDIETLKANHSTEIQTLQEQLQEKDAKVKELEANTSQYADYEELKQFKQSVVEKEEKERKVDYLKSLKCKHPDLFVDKLDWTKATYNEEKKTYEGLEESAKELKAQYVDMFEQTQQIVVEPTNAGSSAVQLTGVEKAFYDLNPDLRK